VWVSEPQMNCHGYHTVWYLRHATTSILNEGWVFTVVAHHEVKWGGSACAYHVTHVVRRGACVCLCVCVFGNIYHFAPHLHHLCQPLFTIIVDTKFSWTSCTILRPYLFIFSWYCQCDGLPGCVRLPAEARHFLMLKPSSPAVISGSILPGEKAAGVWSLLLALSRTHFNKWIHISSRPRAFKAGCQIKHVELNPDPLFLIRTKVRKEHRLGNSSNRALRGTSGALRRFPHPLPLDKCPRNAASFWISFRLLFCSFLMAVKCCRQRQGRRWRSGCTEALQRMRASQRAALGLRWLLTGETQSK
jgi:hypothetical protein